jgi:PIN domain nuclease of toxin-antitoxin system
MQILLDTHIYLWWLKDDHRLSNKARITISDADRVYISSASIWEAAIKIQLGKLKAAMNDLILSIGREGLLELPITAKHAAMISNLPHYHRDPFDRMLIAQAMSEPLRLLTVDEALKPYSELVDLV